MFGRVYTTEVWQDRNDPERPWIVSVVNGNVDYTMTVHRTEKAAQRTARTVRRLLAQGVDHWRITAKMKEHRKKKKREVVG